MREGTLRCERLRAASSPCTAAWPSCCTTRRAHRHGGRRASSASPSTMRADGWDRETGAQAARPRARLLVRPVALDVPAADARSRSSPGRASSTSARTRAGRRTTSPSAGCGRSRWTSRRPSCRGSTRPSTSSTTVACSSSGCSARWTRSRSHRAASTTSTAARCCTTTTPPACAARSRRSSASCDPGGGC